MVVTLRVLGKFLGYLDFMAYRSAEPTVSPVSHLAVCTRQQVQTAQLLYYTVSRYTL